MNRERLIEAKKCLENVIEMDKKFNMSNWINSYEFEKELRKTYPQIPTPLDVHQSPDVLRCYPKTEHFCETTCCALGHMALWKPFNNQGLHLDGSLAIVFDDNNYIWAAMEFFEINLGEAKYIFYPGYYSRAGSITPQDVIQHIDNILDSLVGICIIT